MLLLVRSRCLVYTAIITSSLSTISRTVKLDLFFLLTLGFFLVVLITGLSNICPINEVLTQAFAMLNRFLIN